MIQPTLTADALNQLTATIIGAAIDIHRTFGPGLFENAYLACLVHDLRNAGLELELEKALPLEYRGVRLEVAYRVDIVVARAIIVEVKALEMLARSHSRQLRTYLRLSGCRVGLLLNFGAPTMLEGIKREVNNFPPADPPSDHFASSPPSLRLP